MADIHSPMLQNTKRPQEPTFPVWAPDGHVEYHTRQNINDLVRHLGWYQKDPKSLLAEAERLRERATGILRAAQNTQPTALAPGADGPGVPVVDLHTPRLTALRKELSDQGGVPDPTWGVAKLEQALAARKAGVPMAKDPEDE